MSAAVREVFCVLITLAEGRLLLPRTCIAEVTSLGELKRIPGAPGWLLGQMDWNDRLVPVISFEATTGNKVPTPSTRTRVAIIPAVGNKLRAGFFGLLVQGFPHLVNVTQGALKTDTEAKVEGPVLTRLRMVNERPAIPDLDKLEDMLADHCAIKT